MASVLLLIAAAAPGLILVSQHQLDEAQAGLLAGDCSRVIDRAAASISTLEVRPEPYKLLAICQSERGNPRLALQAIEKAAKRDPGNWRYAYDTAILLGGAGLEPRPALLEANRLNPRQPQITELLATLRKGEAVSWNPILDPESTNTQPYQER
jgi:Flp pilus assembly protein TadD